MATISIPAGHRIRTANYIDGDPGGTGAVQNINDTIEALTIAGLTSNEFAGSAIDGADGTPSLRRLVSNGTDTTAGRALSAADPRLSRLSPVGYARANMLVHNTTEIAIASTAPTPGQVLTYNGTAWIPANVSMTSFSTGTGTISVSSGSPTVTGSGTIFTTELKVGDLIKTAGGAVRRIIAIAGATSLTVDSNWSATESGVAFTYLPAAKPRPYNEFTSKSTSFTVTAADVGQVFACDTGSGAITVTLPACAAFLPGDTVAFIKTTDDNNPITLNRVGTDTIDGGESLTMKTFGSVVLLSTNGVSAWYVVSKKRLEGDVIQRLSASDSTRQTLTNQISLTTTPTTSNGTKLTQLSLTITPRSRHSILRVSGTITGSLDTEKTSLSVAIFSTVGPVATLRGVAGIGVDEITARPLIVPFMFRFTSGTVSPVTIEIYAGPSSGRFYYLGGASGAELWGGNARAVLEVVEEAI